MATIQEILQNQQMGIGQASSDVNFLLKKIAKDMQLAQSEDKQLEQNIKKGGKTFLEGVKTRKDFLLAKSCCAKSLALALASCGKLKKVLS